MSTTPTGDAKVGAGLRAAREDSRILSAGPGVGRHRSWLSRLVLVVGLSADPPDALAQAAPPTLLDAVVSSPALAAARKRIDAARTRIESAGRLADPEIEAMGLRANMVDENRAMWELTVRQPLPKRGERAADRERAQAVVSLAEADYAIMAGELAAEVAMALAEAEGTEARIKLLETQLGRLGALLQSLDARLATGSARMADRLTVQSRIAAMQLSLEKDRRAAEDARAEARARLGLAGGAELPAFAAPAPDEIVANDTPAVRLASARAAEATAMSKMARAAANPMTSVGVRLEREQTRMGNEDTIGLAFMSDLPFRSRRYARSDARAAEADRAAAQADGHAARFRITNALQRVDRAERVADTARRLASQTQARLDAEHEALSRSASVGAGAGMAGDTAVFHAVDILEKSTDTRLQIIEAETSARLARAELWRYLPTPQLLTSTQP